VPPWPEWSARMEQGDWILERLHSFNQDLGSFVPEGFGAYVRILHPGGIAGTLGPDALDALIDVLGQGTTTPERCCFAYWTGFAWMPAVAAVLPVPERPMALREGPIDEAAALMETPTCQSPNLWWPADRAWCVASEVDFRSTYLGASEALVEAVRAVTSLKTVPVSVSDLVRD
jgi:hypothetical protein